MNKSEVKEVTRIKAFHSAGLDIDFVARAISALIRSARTAKSQQELMQVALELKATTSKEFIC